MVKNFKSSYNLALKKKDNIPSPKMKIHKLIEKLRQIGLQKRTINSLYKIYIDYENFYFNKKRKRINSKKSRKLLKKKNFIKVNQ